MATRGNTSTRIPIRELFQRRNVDGLIHEEVSKEALVNKDTFKYYNFDDSNTRIEDDVLAARSGANETDHDYSTASVDMNKYGLKEWIDGDVYDDADDVLGDGREDALMNIKDKLLLAKEKRLADTLFSTGNFSGKTAALTGSNRWDQAGSNPLSQWKTAARAVKINSGFMVNTLILGFDAMQGLQYNESLLALLGDSTIKILTPELIGRLLRANGFNVTNVIVGSATRNTAAKGLTASHDFIWGKYALFCYIDPRPATRKNKTLVKTFVNKKNPYTYGFFEDWDKTKKGEWAYAKLNYIHSLTSVDCGYLFSTVVN